ncbi:DUF2945 domain-containing protein [Sulfitobacter sabulilitoris]|uniref:DUF2945 domain-containing protein n=1 Tax=Sulfitobacter sabulilitoris TaxID=2562655 RepID=A0A5S3PCF7_9RHOB|nr:DUF2945 domain-containing protein [Sulfitobacter sabulilitoris]TMM51277.1 DUF2945 domain-containing protein [Sulfitobacter sabulilitoris]
MASYDTGDTVKWNWGEGTGTGTVRKIYSRNVTRTIKGTEVTRDGSDDDPALLIEQEDGDEVLKLASEVTRA